MPEAVVKRAREVLESLEASSRNGTSAQRRREKPPQLGLPMVTPSAVEMELAAIDPDSLTPREALARLYELKARLKQE
jgi:DNA mismatch repair protein MutS